MVKKDKITYEKTKSIIEIFPDSPDFDWKIYGHKKEPENIEEKIESWNQHLTTRWEEFEHNKKSSIYKYYGHIYDEPSQRTIKVPEGETPSGNFNPMADDLRKAITYRLQNFSNDKKNGWRIFEKITGWYDVEAIDEVVAEDRKKMLRYFVDSLATDEYISRYDPLTNKEAITPVSSSGMMEPIEYMFPLGDADTDYLHYVVLESESKELIIEDDISIRIIIKREILENIINSSSEVMEKKILGKLMNKYKKQFRPRIDFVREELNKWIPEYNTLFLTEGIKSLNNELEALPFQQLEEEPGDGKLVETYKKILVSSLLKKIKDKDLKRGLQKRKPPEKKKKGGQLWPQSKGGEYSLWITADPFEMLTKSTGRAWSEKSASCENWDGCFARGPVSDFKYGNCCVWVYKRGNTEYRQEIGRFILRWANAYKGGDFIGRDVGVEIQVYPKDPSQSPWGFNILGAIGRILKDAGLLNYDYCVTPYIFEGYSDKAGSGNVKIEYDSKIFLKGIGEVEVGDANALVVMANDERMSYGDSGYILNYGNENALLALSMNPIVWAYENTIRRLVNRCLDLEAGNQIVRFLVESNVANFEFIQGIVDNIDLFDEHYGDPLHRGNVCQGLLRNGRCNEGTHYAMQKAHSGYTVDGIDVGGIDEMVYLALFDTNSTLTGDDNYPPMITTIPTEMLDSIVDKLVSNKLSGDKQKRLEIWLERYARNERVLYMDSSPREQKLYKRYREFLVGMKHLMFCPNLSLKSFGKMLTEFKHLYSKYGQRPGVFGECLKTVRNFMGVIISLPFNNEDDWGYCEEYNGIYVGMGNTYNALRYHKFDRQSKRTVVVAAEIWPELVTLNVDGNSPIGIESLLLKNLRVTLAYESLWQNRKELDIDPLSFMSRLMDNKDNSLSVPNRFITPKKEIAILKELSVNYIQLIKESYNYNQENSILRTKEDISLGAIDYLLSDPELIQAIGYNYVATWLNTTEQFLLFEKLVFQEGIGDYYSKGFGFFGGRASQSFEELPKAWNSKNRKDLMRFYRETENIDILQVAACGGISQIGGLVKNQDIPSYLQSALIESQSISGEVSAPWEEISKMYGGSYSEYLDIITNSLVMNTNLDVQLVSELIGQSSELDESLAKNGNIKYNQDFIEKILNINPLWLLNNKHLNPIQYKEIVDYYTGHFVTFPPEERERFNTFIKKRFTKSGGLKAILKKTYRPEITAEEFEDIFEGLEPDHIFDAVVGEAQDGEEVWQYSYDEALGVIQTFFTDYPWLKFWRGGTYKKAMGLPSDNNGADIGKKGEPMALVDSPILIERPQIIITMDMFEKEDEVWERNFQSIKHIQTIVVNEEDELITIEGKDLLSGNKFNQEFTDISQLYEFILPEEREDEDKWRRGIVLVLYDGYKESDIKEIPHWRVKLTKDEFNTSLVDIASNPNHTITLLTSIGDKLEEIKSVGTLYSPIEPIPANIENLFAAIDQADSWTVNFINQFKKELFKTGGFYLNSTNLTPSTKILELSLSLDNVEIRKELGIPHRDISDLQAWILTNFGSKVPIDYIYQMMGHARADVFIKAKARTIREERIREYIDFVTRDVLPEINDAEEGTHNIMWLNFESPKMNNLLLEYVNIKEPNDSEKQEQLLSDITEGHQNIGLEEIIKVVEEERV